MARIIAIGGGGLLDSHDARMHDYVLSQSDAPRPKVCSLATGKGDNPELLDRFETTFARYACTPSVLQLFNREVRDLERFVLEQDIVIVWGGNTASLLAVWRAHGLDEILRKALDHGVLLSGLCAGALVWFEDGIADSFGGLDALGDGLRFLPGSCCPHYDADPGRRRTYHAKLASGAMGPGYAIDVDAAIDFEDGQLSRVVASREGACAWRVERSLDGVTETRLPAEFLNA